MSSRQHNNRQRGKAHEARTAQRFDGARVGLLGGEDVFHPRFSIECKSVQRFVGDKWYRQGIRNNKREDKTTVVSIHIAGTSSNSDYVLLRVDDFLNLINQERR